MENPAECGMCIQSPKNRLLHLLCDLCASGQGTNGMDIDPPGEEIRCHELGCLFCLRGEH